MKIFNEEANKQQDSIILINKKEAEIILSAIKFASEQKPRMLNWKKIYNTLYEKLAIF